jgi:ABC-2 type transport system ATP-binding protein
MDNKMIINTSKLSVKLGGKQILDNINLQVPAKSIYGFLGPNGAGKTTLIRSLLNLVAYNEGTIELLGKSPRKHRMELMRKIGCLVERPVLYPHLTGKENLEIYRKAYGLDKKSIDRVLEIVKMSADANQKTGTYSLGMKQRTGIAIALLHDPELLILDEPANGLDPKGIKAIRELIIKLNKEFDKTIFISSHLLSEVEKISTHVGIINKGKILFQGKISELESIKEQSIRIETTNPAQLAQQINHYQTNVIQSNGQFIDISVNAREDIPMLVQKIIELGYPVYQVKPHTDSDLENSFFKLINQ